MAFRSSSLIALLTSILVLVLTPVASAKLLVDRASGFRVAAPADFTLHVERALRTYRVASAARRVEVVYRVIRTRLSPRQLVARAGGGSRALGRKLGRGRVAVARFRGGGVRTPGTLEALRRIARSASIAPSVGVTASSRSWDSNFAAARSACDFADAGWNSYDGGGDYPYCPASVSIGSSASEGVPTPPSGQNDVARFEVTPADAEASQPRYHAKIFTSFFATGYDEAHQDQHHTRSPADVSGTYRAWYFLPSNYSIPGTGWRNIFQFKERYWDGSQGGYQSDPLYWLALYNGDGNGTPYATVDYWNGGDTGSVGQDVVFPRNRWVEVEAIIRQGQSIEFSVDGRLIATGQNSTYPVAPFHERRSLGWSFGVGNYSGAGESGRWQDRISGAPLFIGGASYRG